MPICVKNTPIFYGYCPPVIPDAARDLKIPHIRSEWQMLFLTGLELISL